MIIPDINLLLYAYDSSSPFHARAATWWSSCLSGQEPVRLPRVVVFGFIRIGTHPRVFENPMTVSEACSHVRSWLERPVAQILEPGLDHVQQVLLLLEKLGTAGSLVTDAQIAALALAYGAVVHTADADFLRFPGLHWFNPITRAASGQLRRGDVRSLHNRKDGEK